MASGAVGMNRATSYRENIQQGKVQSVGLPATGSRNRELFRIKASRLVDFFPDELVVQEKTVSVVRREFMVSFVETLPVRDLGRVIYVNTPLFSGLRLLGKNTAHELHIKGLNKAEAMRAKDILEGLLLDDQGVVDVPEWLDSSTRRQALEQAGQNPAFEEQLEKRARD